MNINIPLPDGRVLNVHEYGDPGGKPVVFIHGGGLGATGLFAAVCDQAAKRLHLQVLAPDRPGLGESSPLIGRTVMDWPKDVSGMADYFRLSTFPIIAHSGGAVFALACALRLQNRVSSVHLTSTMVARSMIIHDKTIPMHIKFKTLCLGGMPGFLLESMFKKIFLAMRHSPEKAAKAFLRRLPACERDVLSSPANQTLLRENVFSALRQGPRHVIDDLRLIMKEWPFPLKEIRQPVSLWHGEYDVTALPQSVKAFAKVLPSAKLSMVADAGHLTTWLCYCQEVLNGI